MGGSEWFKGLLDEYQGDARFVAEELVLDIVGGLDAAMRERGLSRSELAERMGVKPAHVSGVLNGRPNLTLLTLAKFCVALGLQPHIELRPAGATQVNGDAQPNAPDAAEAQVVGPG